MLPETSPWCALNALPLPLRVPACFHVIVVQHHVQGAGDAVEVGLQETAAGC